MKKKNAVGFPLLCVASAFSQFSLLLPVPVAMKKKKEKKPAALVEFHFSLFE